MYALVDCNNFYASCERVFNPAIRTRPVVVLSNNDGCVIARSNEAKALGFKMGDPYFKVKPQIAEHGVAVFSSNYTLYGDMSQRVVQTLEQLAPTVEVYSIDEAFLELSGFTDDAMHDPGRPYPPHRAAMDRHPGQRRHRPDQNTRQGRQPRRQETPRRPRRLVAAHALSRSTQPCRSFPSATYGASAGNGPNCSKSRASPPPWPSASNPTPG